MRSSPRLLLIGVALFVLLLLAGAGILLLEKDVGGAAAIASRDVPRPGMLKAGAFDPPLDAPEFSLAGSDGTEVTLARYRGKVVLLSFGFTYCAAVCPTTLSTLAQARNKLGGAADSVQVIFVTVDPARDDAAHLRDYLAAFDPTFIGATGTPDILEKVRRDYGVKATRQGAGPDYAMAHTSSIFLIDRAGKLRAMMPFGRDAGDFVHDVNRLLVSA